MAQTADSSISGVPAAVVLCDVRAGGRLMAVGCYWLTLMMDSLIGALNITAVLPALHRH